MLIINHYIYHYHGYVFGAFRHGSAHGILLCNRKLLMLYMHANFEGSLLYLISVNEVSRIRKRPK
jgi:hypothetical protein